MVSICRAVCNMCPSHLSRCCSEKQKRINKSILMPQVTTSSSNQAELWRGACTCRDIYCLSGFSVILHLHGCSDKFHHSCDFVIPLHQRPILFLLLPSIYIGKQIVEYQHLQRHEASSGDRQILNFIAHQKLGPPPP